MVIDFKSIKGRLADFRGYLRRTSRAAMVSCKYFFRRLKVRIIFAVRALKLQASEYSEVIYRLIYLGIILMTLSVLYRWGPHPLLSREAASQFFMSAGAMTGGAVAIIFTLSVFALQTAAERYSAGIFRIYAKSNLEQIIFYLLSFLAFTLFASGLLFGELTTEETPVLFFDIGAYVGLAIIGLTFLLIHWLYTDIKKRVDPIAALLLLRSSLQKSIILIGRDAQRMAYISQPAKDVSQEMFDKLNLTAAHASLNQHLELIDVSLAELFEITKKLIERGELENANLGLRGIGATICEYLDVRRQSAVILPASVFLATTSDVNQFVVNNLERFIALGERQLKNGDEIVAQYIIRQFVTIAKYANQMEFVNDRTRDNPVMGMVLGYLKQFIKKAVSHQKLDAVLEGIRATAETGEMLVHKRNQLLLAGWHSDMYDLALSGLALKQEFLTQETLDHWTRILAQIVSCESLDVRIQFNMALERISGIVLTHRSIIASSGLERSVSISNIQITPFANIRQLLYAIAVQFDKMNETNKEHILRIYLHLVDELYNVLRRMSEKIKQADDLFIGEVANIISTLGETMLYLSQQNSWNDQKDDLIDQVGWYLHLPSWFCTPASTIEDTMSFWSLVDAPAKVGLVALNLGEISTAKSATESIYSIVKIFLRDIPATSQYTEPRILMKNVYIGVLALKKGQIELFTGVAKQIWDFEDAYYRKHVATIQLPPGSISKNIIGLPQKDQLLTEALRWRDEFASNKYNRFRLMNDSQEFLYDLVEDVDIDRFIFEVWGCFPAHSRLEKEIEEREMKRARARQIKKLLGVLNYRLSSPPHTEITDASV